MQGEEARKQAAARVVSRWLSGLKSRRVKAASRLTLSVWLRSEEDGRAAAAALTAAGALSFSFTSEHDHPPGSANPEMWTHSVVASFPAEHSMLVNGLRQVNQVTGAPGAGVPFQAEAVMGAEWAAHRETVYRAVQVQHNFWLLPVWSSSPPEASGVSIILEPTYAAWPGKGTVDGLEHPATVLVLRCLASGCLRGGERVMDYGTGSGVLAVAALKFGAAHAVGVDIDPVCVTTTRKNMARNGMEESQFSVLCGGDVAEAEPLETAGLPASSAFDVCMLNVLVGDMQRLRMRILGYLKPGGLVILSGMLTEQVPEIMLNFAPHITDIETEEFSGWTRITGRLSECMSL